MRVTTVMYQMETDAFLSVSTIISKKILAWSISNSYNHIKEELMLCVSLCRVPEICDRYKIGMVIYNLGSKKILPRSVKQRDKCVYTHKDQYSVI